MVLACWAVGWLYFSEQTSSYPLPAHVPLRNQLFFSYLIAAGRWGPTQRTGAEWSGRTDPVCKKMPPSGYGHFVLAAVDPQSPIALCTLRKHLLFCFSGAWNCLS